MKIKKSYLLIIISTLILGINTPSIKAQVFELSVIKADIYVKISGSASGSYQDKKNNISVVDNYSIMVEGNTELSASYFDDDEGYYELLPIKTDIKATCNGKGSSERCSWTYSFDGKELKNGHDEYIELINSLYVYPSEEKDKPPSYKIYFNDDALAAINHYHTLIHESCKSEHRVVEGEYGLNTSLGSYYTLALEDKNGLENFKERKFEVENGKFVSEGNISYSYTSESGVCNINIIYGINRKPQVKDKDIQVNGCESVVVGETRLLPVTLHPKGGKVKYWAEGKGISISDGGNGVKVTGTEPGEGTVWIEYTTADGQKMKKSKSMTSLRLNSINQGEPIKIGLYDAKGRRLKALKTVPVKVEPEGKSDQLNYSTNEAIVDVVPTGNSQLNVHGLSKGKTTIQAVSNCGANTGPPLNVEILNCDDEVIKELKRQASQLQSRLKSNLSQQNELLSNDDFIQADKNSAKAIDDVAQGLQSVAIMMATPKAGGETTFYKGLEFLSSARSMYGHVVTDQNTALAGWETANMIAGDNMAQKVSSALKTVTELGKAAVDLGGYLGTTFGVASRLAELTEQHDKTQKELEEVKRIMCEVCGRDEVNPKGDPDDNDGDEQPKEDPEKQPKNDPKKNDPKSNQKNQPEAKDAPPNTPEPTSSKTGNDTSNKTAPEPQDQTSKTDKSSSDPKTYSVGIDIEPEGECKCAPNLDSKTMLSPDNSQETDEVLRLMIGINDVQHCYNNFSEVTMVPLIKGMKSIEAFYVELETFLNVSEKEREKEFEKLKASLLELELDKMQPLLFQVEEFRFASGGCGAQIKDKIHTGLKMK